MAFSNSVVNTGFLLKDLKFGGKEDDIFQCSWFVERQDGSYSRCVNDKDDDYFCDRHSRGDSAPEMREKVDARTESPKA